MARKGTKGVRVAIVVEGEALERLCRQVLLELGYGRRELFVTPYPVGRGSAKDWVNSQFAVEVAKRRSKAKQDGLAILVGTDADELTVAKRVRQLEESLTANGMSARQDGEQFAFWIPKWNVETWLLYFAGDRRDEEANYKNQARNVDYSVAATSFVSEYRNSKTDEPDTLPSLLAAYNETNRLKA